MTRINGWQFTCFKKPVIRYVSLPFFAVLSLTFVPHAHATIDNIVTVTGSSPGGTNDVTDTDTESVDVVDAINELTVVKTATLNDEIVADGLAEAGETITYTFDVTNSGNVTITNVRINDTTNATNGPVVPDNEVILTDVAPAGDSLDPSGVNQVWDSIAPGDTIRFSATYTVTQTDVDTLN